MAEQIAATTTQSGTTQQGASDWKMPEKFAGKSAEDVARAYTELERDHGKISGEYGKLMETVTQWRDTWNAWDPVLSKIGYQPAALGELLDRADQLRAMGNERGAQQIERQVERTARSWADITDPREQGAYIDERLSGLESSLGDRVNQMMTDFSQAMAKYVNNYGQLATRAMSMKIANPSLDINKLLAEAANIGGGKYDPLEWAARILDAPNAEKSRIDEAIAEAKKQWQKEQNDQITVLAGGNSMKSPYRTVTPPGHTAPNNGPSMSQQKNAARERFLQNYPNIRPPGSG